MKIFNKRNNILTSVLVSSTIMFSLVPTNFASEQITDAATNNGVKASHSFGYLKPTEEGYKWIDENVIKTEKVGLNELGLERVNKARKKKKLTELGKDIVAKNGDEATGTILKSVSTDTKADRSVNSLQIVEPMQSSTSQSYTYSLGIDSLPSSVDNSLLPAFPPIGDQDQIGSCSAFASVYYQMTHMTALVQGWNTKDPLDYSKRFSPKWAYNLTNNGQDNGTSFDNVYRLLSKSGCATWQDFPYSGDNKIPQNYLEWPTQSSIYKNAMKYKIDKIGCLSIYDGTDTPVTGPQDSNLTQLKTLLSDGYVLTFGTDVLSWVKTTLKNDPATPNDDNFAGQYTYYMQDGFDGGHAMTVVGYNDDVWCDVNGNGKVEIGEKGALKIANSWGVKDEYEEQNDGFRWLCYDALNSVSSVSGAPPAQNWRTFPLHDNNRLYWITVKKDYTPKLIAEFTVNSPKRRQFSATLGYSSKTDTVPSLNWKPFFIADSKGRDYSFDGTTTPCNATFALDFTDLYSNNFANTDGNWYLKIKDDTNDTDVTNLYNFKLIDNVKGTEINSNSTFPVTCNGSTSLLSIYNTRTLPQTTEWTIRKNLPELKNNFASAGLNGKIYIFGGSTNNYSSNSVYEYNTSTDMWSKKANMPCFLNYASATTQNDKILIVGYQDIGSDRQRVVYEYNPLNDTYKQKSNLNYNVALKKKITASSTDLKPIQAIDDDLLISKWAGSNSGDKWLHIDLGANYKIDRWVVHHAGAAGDSQMSNTRDFSLQKSSDGVSWVNVDSVTGNTSNITDRFVNSFTTRYIGINITKAEQGGNGVANIYEFQVYGTNADTPTVTPRPPAATPTALPYRGKIKMVSANNKMYIFNENNNKKVEEYDPATGIMTFKADMPVSLSEAAITSLNNKVYVMGGRDKEKDLLSNSVYVFDPVLNKWSNAKSMPISKMNFDAESINGKIYTFGGYLWGQTYYKNIEEYNPLTDTWLTKSSMLQDLDYYNLVKINNKIYSLGGNFYNFGPTKLVASFQ